MPLLFDMPMEQLKEYRGVLTRAPPILMTSGTRVWLRCRRSIRSLN